MLRTHSSSHEIILSVSFMERIQKLSFSICVPTQDSMHEHESIEKAVDRTLYPLYWSKLSILDY